MQAYSHTLCSWWSSQHTFWITPEHTVLFASIVTFLFALHWSSLYLFYFSGLCSLTDQVIQHSWKSFKTMYIELRGLRLARGCVICLIFGCYRVLSRQLNIRHIPTESGALSSHWSISPKPNLLTLCGLHFHSFINYFTKCNPGIHEFKKKSIIMNITYSCLHICMCNRSLACNSALLYFQFLNVIKGLSHKANPLTIVFVAVTHNSISCCMSK